MLPLPADNPTLAQARDIMTPLIKEFVGKPEILAVYVLSSSAVTDTNPTRFDEESDFDIALVFDIPFPARHWRPRPSDTYQLIADRIPVWVPPFLFDVDVPWGQMEVNIHQLVFQYEADPRTIWGGEKCDTYVRKGEMVSDRGGAFQRLIHTKDQSARQHLEAERQRLANRITWDVAEMPLRQARRLGPQAGHHVLNTALEEVIDCLYATRQIFPPNRKWKFAHLSTHKLITPQQHALLDQALRCEPTTEDLRRRIHALERFCASVGLPTGGPQATHARARHQATIQLRPSTSTVPYPALVTTGSPDDRDGAVPTLQRPAHQGHPE